MKKKTPTIEETEIVRLSKVFRKLLRLISKELLAKKFFDQNEFYKLIENFDVDEEVSVSLQYIQYKFTNKYFPKVILKCEIISLKEAVKTHIFKGQFSLRKPSHKNKEDNYYVNDYKVKIIKNTILQ